MSHVNQVIATSPRRIEILLNGGKEIVFVINKNGKFGWAAKSHGISKAAFREACRVAGQEFARQKQLRQKSIAA